MQNNIQIKHFGSWKRTVKIKCARGTWDKPLIFFGLTVSYYIQFQKSFETSHMYNHQSSLTPFPEIILNHVKFPMSCLFYMLSCYLKWSCGDILRYFITGNSILGFLSPIPQCYGFENDQNLLLFPFNLNY